MTNSYPLDCGKTQVVFGCLLVALFVAGLAQAKQELGIDRSGLSSQSEGERQKTLQDIHSLKATWFRDGPNSSSPQGIASFVDEVRLAKQLGLKVLDIVLPQFTDYDGGPNENAGEDFRKRCGWPQGSAKLSEINLQKFQDRLRADLSALKAANLMIDAFEIGNELDGYCFNGDVPNGHAASDAELKRIVRAYGEFLKSAALVIRDPHYFQQAKIITFGIAHGSDQWDKPPHHISNPAHMIAMLRNIDGFNYLDNAQYHVDGYGTHIYPWAGEVAGSVRNTLKQDSDSLGKDKPLWVTEWGFLQHSDFPNRKGQTLTDGMKEILTTFDSMAREIPLGPVMFYTYNGWLSDGAGHLLPTANVLSAYASDP
jgi:hypothetical protein